MSALRERMAAAALAVLVFARPAVAKESLEDAKKLYEAASFERALDVLGDIDAETAVAKDVLEYKALCLIALGRSGEAQLVVDALVTTSPTFQPTAGDVSPRFAALVNDSRRRLLPELTKRIFNGAREQFRAKDTAAAKESFERVLRLTGDGPWKDSNEAEDLRTLASGFLELVNAAAETATSVDLPPARAADPVSSPTPVNIVAPAVARRQSVDLRPPVPIEQVFPKWRPTDAVTAQRHFVGAVRIRIGTDGRVVNAAIEVATDPDYDRQLLEASKSWRYEPGRRNGEPIETEKLVTFALRMH